MFKLSEELVQSMELFVGKEYVAHADDSAHNFGGCMDCSNSCAEKCAYRCKGSHGNH